MSSKNVSFYQAKDPAIERKRRLAQVLMEQEQQPQGTEVISGVAVKQSPLSGLAKALTQGVGGMQERQAEEMERAALAEYLAQQEQPPLPTPPSRAQQLAGAIQPIPAAQSQTQQAPYGPTAPKAAKIAKALSPQIGPAATVPARAQQSISQPAAPQEDARFNPGVPEQAPDPFAGVQGRSRDALINNVRQGAIKRINDKDTIGQLNAARGLKEKMGRFEDLLEVQDTGGALINTPLIGSAMKTFDPELSEMQSIQSEIAPKMRVPGSGSSSDIDVQMFKQATIGPEKPKQTNENIAKAFSTAQQNLIDRDQFLRDYLDYHGHIQGAEQSWNDYLNNNPIFSPDSTAEAPTLNPDRKDYREYFGGSEKDIPSESKADKIRTHMKSKGASPEQIEAFIKENGVE